MSRLAVGPRKNIERQIWTEITPQALYDKCQALAKNLWWSWHPEVVNLFRDLDPIKWRKIDHNPIMLLSEMTPEQLAERAAEMVLYTRINQAHRRLKEYLTRTRTTSSSFRSTAIACRSRSSARARASTAPMAASGRRSISPIAPRSARRR